MLTLVAKSAEALTLIALATVVPRALGPADYGLFAVVLALVGIVSMSLSLGGPLLLSRFVPAAPAAEREALALALALRIAITLVAVLAVVVPERFPTAAALFVSIALVLDVAATLLYQVALALGRPRLWSFRFPLQNTLLVVAALSLHATAGVNGAIAAVAIASGGAFMVGVALVVRQLRPAKPLPILPSGALRFGILQGVSGFFVQISLRGNVPLVLLLTGPSPSGRYSRSSFRGCRRAPMQNRPTSRRPPGGWPEPQPSSCCLRHWQACSLPDPSSRTSWGRVLPASKRLWFLHWLRCPSRA
jgi:O-antigen/teichoic acid export membrane protein